MAKIDVSSMELEERVGDGKVGHTVAEQLTREGHDVVIIDKNEDVLQRCEDTLDVLCILGRSGYFLFWNFITNSKVASHLVLYFSVGIIDSLLTVH